MMLSIDSNSLKYCCKNFNTESNFDQKNAEKRHSNALYTVYSQAGKLSKI